MAKKLAPMHPGEVLREEFLLPLNLSAGALAKACDLPRTRIERIAAETTGITVDTALRLGKALGTSAQLWLNLQNEQPRKTTDPVQIQSRARSSRTGTPEPRGVALCT